MLRSEIDLARTPYVACASRTDDDGLIWPDGYPEEGEFFYRGNAHSEAADHGIRQDCQAMHPDDPRDCVPCAVEGGTALQIQWPHLRSWTDCSRRCQPGHIDDECITHMPSKAHRLHKVLGSYLANCEERDEDPYSGDVQAILDHYWPTLKASEPLADWELALLQDRPEVGDQVRLVVNGTVDRKREQLKGAPTIYRINTGDDDHGQWVNVQIGGDYDKGTVMHNVTLVTTTKFVPTTPKEK